MTKLIAKDVFGNDHEVDSKDMTWRIHAYGVVIDGDKVLLSPQHGDRFDLPGGKVEIDEMMEDGLAREVEEETGIKVKVKELLGVKDIYFKVTFREPQEVWHSVMLYYACEKTGGEISTELFDEHEKRYAEAAVWKDINELDAIIPASSVNFIPFVKLALLRHDTDTVQ